MPPTTDQGVVQRSIPLSRIVTADAFNPRTAIVRDQEFDTLVATVRQHGVLQPIRVRETTGGDYVLIAGERRYCAAIEASLMEIPAIIRPAGDGSDEQEAALLVEAVIENDVRVGLSCVQRANGYARLRRGGLTVKGIAQQLGRSQRHVREHLQILDLPTDLHPRLDRGEIPLKVVATLRTLAATHPGLPVALVDAVVGSQEQTEPWSWDDAIARTFDVLADSDLPDGVYAQHEPYPIEPFELGEKARKDLAAYEQLTGRPLEVVRFDHGDVQRASALGAAIGDGPRALIIGSDVAAQLLTDDLATSLRQARKQARENANAAASPRQLGHAGADTPDAAGAPAESDEQRQAREKEQRAAAREAELAARRTAEAFNERLGGGLVKNVSRVKVDSDVMKVLTSVTFGAHLTEIAMRGARYGFPGWFIDESQKNKTSKRAYLDTTGACAKAQEYLAGASSPGDYAGRAIALLVMATLADQDAVAMSNRVHHTTAAHGTPWVGEVAEILDAIAEQALPGDEQLAALLADRRAARAAAISAREHREQLQVRVSDGLAKLDTLTVEQVNELRGLLQDAYDRYSMEFMSAERALRDRQAAIQRDAGVIKTDAARAGDR